MTISKMLLVALTITIIGGCTAAAEDDHQQQQPEKRKAMLLVGNASPIECEQIEDACILEGDIGLTESQLGTAAPEGSEIGKVSSALLASSGTSFKWPNGVVPYTIDPNLAWSIRTKVDQAITHWQTQTSIRFVPRTTEGSWVSFVPSAVGYAWANIGRQGGKQTVNLVYANPVGVIVHELGHTLGFWHEHTRPDRDSYVTIHWGNIRSGLESNFYTLTTGMTVGPYDIDSIMHYPSYEFSRNGYATITRKNGTTYPTNYTALSAGDIAAVQQLYGGNGTPGEIIIDSNNARNDTAKGYIEVTENWTAWAAGSGYWGTGFWVGTTTSGPSDAATFWFYVPVAGERTIDAWWSAAWDRSSNAPWVVRNGSGTELAKIVVDQRTSGSTWNTLGKWTFPAGWNRVELRRDTGATGSFVIADAVRIR
jgi:hypothetical protein